MSGLDGTPGHETIEWKWFTYEGQTVFIPVPTAYSGMLSMPGSIVALTSSIVPQNINYSKILNDAIDRAKKRLTGEVGVSTSTRNDLQYKSGNDWAGVYS